MDAATIFLALNGSPGVEVAAASLGLSDSRRLARLCNTPELWAAYTACRARGIDVRNGKRRARARAQREARL